MSTVPPEYEEITRIYQKEYDQARHGLSGGALTKREARAAILAARTKYNTAKEEIDRPRNPAH